jgi:hypothetical protein
VAPPQLEALRASVGRLRAIVEPLDDAALGTQAYPSKWTVAQVLSHMGSGAVIMHRRLDDGLEGESVPDDFPPTSPASTPSPTRNANGSPSPWGR